MLIQVLRKGGFFDYVNPVQLEQLLKQNSVVCFKRGDGVAIVGQDPTRDATSEPYFGVERRKI